MTTKELKCNDIDIANALRNIKKDAKDRKRYEKIKDIKISMNRAFENAKTGTEKLKDNEFFNEKAKMKKTKPKKPSNKTSSSDGRVVNKGIDDSQREPFGDDEVEHLYRMLADIKIVNKLDYDCLRFLVCQVYLDELKRIKAGKLKSKIHDEYVAKGIKAKAGLLADMRTNLFTNNQIDYINGLLQGVFDTTEKDNKGDIKHSEIDYVLVVMFTEITIRIVKYVHKLKTNKQAQNFIIKSGDDFISDSE